MQNLIYSDANEAANPTQILDKTMAEAIRAVQIRENAREANGWVDIVAIDEELSTRLENSQAEIDYEYEDLPDVRDASRLIDVELQDGEIVARLSDDGETEVQPETGTARSAGGMSHDAVLMDTETALTERGFSVDILEQDGASNPTPPRRTQTTTWCSTSRPRRRRLTDPRKSCRTSNERTTQIASRSSSSALAILRPSGRRDSRNILAAAARAGGRHRAVLQLR